MARHLILCCMVILHLGITSAEVCGTRSKVKSKKGLIQLARQVQMDEMRMEEATRYDGYTGLGPIRLRGGGSRPYHGASHSDDYTVQATHDHSDFFNTCGNGELVIYLNGHTAATRHNDYLLVRRGNVGNAWDNTVDLPYPDTPHTVMKKDQLKKKIPAMRKYFEAFVKQNESIANYKPYFKANLCYLVGGWFESDPCTLEEAFFSERHFYNARSWLDLYQKQTYVVNSGTKDNLENYAFMPTRIWDINEKTGEIIYAQFNYKILCHELKDDLPLNRLRAVDDLRARMSLRKTFEEYKGERNARFQVDPFDSDLSFDGPKKWGLIDRLMEEVPGPDGYGAYLEDNAFGNLIKRFDTPADDDTPLNAAYFHNWFQNRELGANGAKTRLRGYSDSNMYVALTTQPNVLPSRVERCDYEGKNCESWEQKWVYAFPLEIIYTTPLNAWNPFDIAYHGLSGTDEGDVAVADGRDGTNDPDKAFDGTNSATYYMTPKEFYEGGEFGEDPADTPAETMFVLDKDGEIQEVRSTGIRVITPSIPGIGRVRQRYPIAPVHGEGKPVWMELAALSDIVLNPEKFKFMLREGEGGGPSDQPIQLKLGPATHQFQHHIHYLVLSPADQHLLIQGTTVEVLTETTLGHEHLLEIERNSVNGVVSFRYLSCNGQPHCTDGHPTLLMDP